MPRASPRNEPFPRTGCCYCSGRGTAFVLDGGKAVNLGRAEAFRYLSDELVCGRRAERRRPMRLSSNGEMWLIAAHYCP